MGEKKHGTLKTTATVGIILIAGTILEESMINLN